MRHIWISLITATGLSLSCAAAAQDKPAADTPQYEAPKQVKPQAEKADKPVDGPADPLADFYDKAEEQGKTGPYCHKPEPIA